MVQNVILIILIVALIACAVSLYIVSCQLVKVRKNDRMKRAFLNNVGREIRTPLKSVVELSNVISKTTYTFRRTKSAILPTNCSIMPT